MSDNPTVKEILIEEIEESESINTFVSIIELIHEHLESKEYGGLYSGVCGCKLADLAPMTDCGDSILDCQAGYENKCNDIEDECEYKGSGCTSCIAPNKPEATNAGNDGK